MVSQWNTPSLLSVAGMALYGSSSYLYWDPLLISSAENHPLPLLLLLLKLSSYGMNLLSVSIPGRLDGSPEMNPQNSSANTSGTTSSSGAKNALTKSLVTPSGWAFAIWGPIFLGEFISVVEPVVTLAYSSLLHKLRHANPQDVISSPSSVTKANLIRISAGPFIIAQLYQSLWCAAFRPKFQGYSALISVGMLSMTAWNLNQAHAALCSYSHSSGRISLKEYMIHVLPISLHFGWTTAASLVNLNGSLFKLSPNITQKTRSLIGHVSVVAASIIGAMITWKRGAPVYGGVIAWALSAVADSMNQQELSMMLEEELVEKKLKDEKKATDMAISASASYLRSVSIQKYLCKAGALINISVLAIVTELGLKRKNPGYNN